jgi:hypothetical protein
LIAGWPGPPDLPPEDRKKLADATIPQKTIWDLLKYGVA